MSEAQPMPAGVRIGGLGRRFLAQLIDAIFPALLAGVLAAVVWFNWTQNVLLVAGIAYAVLLGGWSVLVWWMFAERGAGPGMRALRLELVGTADGAPIGWGRFFLRQLVLGACAALALPLVVLVIMLIINPRKQGWHDLAAKSIVIAERSRKRAGNASAPARAAAASVAASTTVGLPAHVAPRGFALQAPGSVNPAPAGAAPTGSPAARGTPPAQYASGQAVVGFVASAADVRLNPGAVASGAGLAQPGQHHPASAQAPPNPTGFAGAPPHGQARGPQPPASQYPPSQPPQHYAQQPAPDQPQQGYVRSQPYGQPPAQQFGAQPYGQHQQFSPAPAPGPQGGFPVAPPPGGLSAPASGGVRGADDGGTRIARRNESAAPTSWIIRLDDGREVPVGALVLIGRNPQPLAGEQGARLVRAGENGRMVSKTHLAIGQDERGLFVMDRGSTNGTAVANPAGDYEPCAAGDPVRLREGQVVSFGEHTLTVRRA